MGIFSHLYTLLMVNQFNPTTSNHTYTLRKTIGHENFFNEFTFMTNPDSETKKVNYLGMSAAENRGLIGWAPTEQHTVFLSANSSTNGAGDRRDSVWARSKDTFQAGTLVIVDLPWMPGNACGPWSRIYTSNTNAETFYSEIDILQTANLRPNNRLSLRLDPSQTCRFSNILEANNTADPKDCAKPRGCHVDSLQGDISDGWNNATGGIWAMSLEHDAIRVWRIWRAQFPAELSEYAIGSTVDVGAWGRPIANFEVERSGDHQGDNCDILGIFVNQALNFKIGYCGEQAGPFDECATLTGYRTCEDYVRDSSTAFGNVRFEINSVRIYGH